MYLRLVVYFLCFIKAEIKKIFKQVNCTETLSVGIKYEDATTEFINIR